VERLTSRSTLSSLPRSGGLRCVAGAAAGLYERLPFPDRPGPGLEVLAAGGTFRVHGPEALAAGGNICLRGYGSRSA